MAAMLGRTARTAVAAALGLGFLGACGDPAGEPPSSPRSPGEAAPKESPEPADAAGAAPLTGEAALAALRDNVAEIAARPEHQDRVIEVSHILVAPEGIPGIPVEDRTPEQAEQLAAVLFARVKAGEDFESVRAPSTNDPGPPVYKLTLDPRPSGGAASRTQMVPAFGDVGWRLAVGEVGVAPFDAQKSPYGWHIIKRVK
jgi:hypothetical protein